jgi:hypothetical protein
MGMKKREGWLERHVTKLTTKQLLAGFVVVMVLILILEPIVSRIVLGALGGD